MKRLFFGLGVLFAIAGLLAGLCNEAVGARGADDVTINSFQADYYVHKDAEGRSTLKTVERITAEFPQRDQNHGIERAIPQHYDGHSTSLRIVSMADDSGHEIPYSERTSGDNLVLRIGDGDAYVHGLQAYVITYTQRDVTKFFSNTNDDEFYWDVNGTGWDQPMGEMTARVHVDAALAAALNEKSACYKGAEGSTAQCKFARENTANQATFVTSVKDVKAHETVTIALGFAPQTFAAYEMSWSERAWVTIAAIWITLQVISIAAATGLFVSMAIRYNAMKRHAGGSGIVATEYLPPNGTSVLVSAQVLGNMSSDVTAQILDLAVRHYVKIYQTKDKSLFSTAEYELELAKPMDDLAQEERRLVKCIFGSNAASGARFAMKKLTKDYAFAKNVTKNRKKVQELARGEYGLFERSVEDAAVFKKTGIITSILGSLTLSPLLIIAAVAAFILAGHAWLLTRKGAELKTYLAGLKKYIQVAEKERIKMLQSPEGAEKVGRNIDSADTAQLVKLYERVLPYAVLFGIEKEWVKQLGEYYETAGSQPDWYSGNGAFNAVVFTSALNGFSSQSSSYTSSSSSSDGGSGGGGYSGGGGGGGGGGSW